MGTIPSVIYPSSNTWLGIGRELVTATPVLPVATIPLDKGSFSPEDTPRFLPDEAIRGVMAQLYNDVLGPEDATFSYGGPNFLDVDGFWFDNILGDLSTTSNGTLGSASPFGTATAIGATSFAVAPSIGSVSTGSVIQISDGSASEVVVATAGSTGTAINCTNNPLRFAHTTSATAALQSAATNYTHTFSLLNSGSGQPPTHTVTDNYNITPTVGARSYPSACLSQLDLTGNAEQLLDVKVSGNSWISAPAASKPANTTAFVVPVANWRSTVSVGGTQIYDIGEWAVSFKRQLQVYWTAQNAQNPYVIARGGLGVTGTLAYSVAVDESPLTQMTAGSPLAVSITLSNGLTGANALSLTLQMTRSQVIKAKPTRNAVLVGFDDEWEALANTTDVGGSAGLSPCKVTLVNAQATY